ncbi:sodium:solute symporter family transporter [Leptolyngbya sp. 7M]|uniref:sodium:solute symporter family transporter n=1 Tax=Leptolyngbya sp. 7M TaxID=2812896 RepID=UPI001B8B0469|nr:hypothetical protein [Leptolyngbya sp. 7M]QYO65654.1 hypothetical protein JVX88_02370 [Leptolyngbya sp. 7M]
MKTISSLIKAGNLRASLLFVCLFIMPIIASAQAAKLSLADLLVGLRSQKVSLEERNRILSEAIKERGVTFTTSAVIESELIAAGASQVLIDALRQVAAPKPQPTPAPTPIPTPTPPDWSFYVKRAEENVGKGELQLALADFDKAAEMRSDSSQVFAGRARTHFELKSYDKAIADYDRVVELLPKDPAAYYFRGSEFQRIQADHLAAFNERREAAIAFANDREANREKYIEANERFKNVRSEAVGFIKENGNRNFNDVNYVFPTFILEHMPMGVIGLLIAAIFAAAMSSISSELNALATATTADFYWRLFKPEGTDGQFILFGRIATFLWGVFACVVAIFATNLGSLIEVVNKFGSFFYGSLLGVFVLAFVVKRARARGAFFGLLFGITSVWIASWYTKIEFLWFNVIGCLVTVAAGYLISLTVQDDPDVKVKTVE